MRRKVRETVVDVVSNMMASTSSLTLRRSRMSLRVTASLKSMLGGTVLRDLNQNQNHMARIALLDGSDCQLNDHETAIVQGIGRRFKDWSDLHEALVANEPRCYSGIRPSMRQITSEVRAQTVVGNRGFQALV